ncbi:MAG TPA: hypothetical protein VJ123_02085 [Anaerolineales bacterium]|nr:hypothetical protein [Anaerolineales bacterium]
MAAIYKVSYVIPGEDHPGAIVNTEEKPTVGDQIQLGDRQFVIVELIDLMPARGEFHFLHATLKPVPT